MSDQKLEELKKAEIYFNNGEIDETLRIFNDLSQIKGLDIEKKIHFQFYYGLILLYQGNFEDVVKFGEKVLKEGQKLKNDYQTFDGYFFIGLGMCQLYKFDDALKIVEKAERLLKDKSNFFESSLIQKKTRIGVLKAWIYLEKNDLELVEKCLKGPLSLEITPDIAFEVVFANILMARTMFQGRSKFDLGLKYTKNALRLAKQIKFNHFWVALCYLYIGVINLNLTEFEISLKYYLKSLTIFRKIRNTWAIALTINNTGAIYFILGDNDLALKYYKESLLLFEKQNLDIQIPLANLIEISIENDDMKSAQEYFNRLEKLYNEQKECLVPFMYLLSKALILKKSSRIRDIAEAENLLKNIADSETLWSQTTISAIIYLCDLLLSEFRINNNNEVFNELNHYIIRLLNIAEKRNSYRIFCETFILQAKLALIQFDMKSARRFLTQAQKIAESYDIKRLAKKISYEHDELLKGLHKWELLNESKANLTERIKLARLDEQISIMLNSKYFEVPEISRETPVMLLILTEGGDLLFSKRFVENISFEDDILGGFLTTVNYFITEVFSEGLDRAVFGQYTLLMKPLQPFLICYIFKGYSYFAHHKTQKFLKAIQNNSLIWQSLQTFLQKSRSIQLKDIPSLESMITEIFVEKEN